MGSTPKRIVGAKIPDVRLFSEVIYEAQPIELYSRPRLRFRFSIEGFIS